MSFAQRTCVNPMPQKFTSSMHSYLNCLVAYSPHFSPLGGKIITKRTPKHPYHTRSKSRPMADLEEVQEQM